MGSTLPAVDEENESAEGHGRIGAGISFAAIVSAVAALFQLANIVTAIIAVAVAATIFAALRSVPRSVRWRWLPWTAAPVVLLATAGTVYLLRSPASVPAQQNPGVAASVPTRYTVPVSPSSPVPAPAGTSAPSRFAPSSVEATFGLTAAEYVDVDLGRIVVQDSQDVDASDYQIEPGTITPRGHARLAPQGGDTH